MADEQIELKRRRDREGSSIFSSLDAMVTAQLRSDVERWSIFHFSQKKDTPPPPGGGGIGVEVLNVVSLETAVSRAAPWGGGFK